MLPRGQQLTVVATKQRFELPLKSGRKTASACGCAFESVRDSRRFSGGFAVYCVDIVHSRRNKVGVPVACADYIMVFCSGPVSSFSICPMCRMRNCFDRFVNSNAPAL